MVLSAQRETDRQRENERKEGREGGREREANERKKELQTGQGGVRATQLAQEMATEQTSF